MLGNFSEIRQRGADYEFGADLGDERLVFYVSFKTLTDVFDVNPVVESRIVALYNSKRAEFSSAAQRAWDGQGHSSHRVRLEQRHFTDL
jgi:hypothetical protein